MQAFIVLIINTYYTSHAACEKSVPIPYNIPLENTMVYIVHADYMLALWRGARRVKLAIRNASDEHTGY